MRLTKERAAENRRLILEAASRLFRERGFDVGVAEIMSAAGFTHGGFYNHFSSKEVLASETCAREIGRATSLHEHALERKAPSSETWANFATSYLSADHRDGPSSGCAIAALAADAGRQPAEVQAPFADGIERMTTLLGKELERVAGPDEAASPREAALRLLSELVGAIILSRATNKADPRLSDEILEANRATVARMNRQPYRATRSPKTKARRAGTPTGPTRK